MFAPSSLLQFPLRLYSSPVKGIVSCAGATGEGEIVGDNGNAPLETAVRPPFDSFNTTDSPPTHQVDRTLRVRMVQGHGQVHDLPQLQRLIGQEIHPVGAQVPGYPATFVKPNGECHAVA